MRLSIRDALGTVFTALASVYGIAFLLGADVPLAPSTRVVALAVVLPGGVILAMWAGTTLRHAAHEVGPRSLGAPSGTPA